MCPGIQISDMLMFGCCDLRESMLSSNAQIIDQSDWRLGFAVAAIAAWLSV